MGSDGLRLHVVAREAISIHAPAWGATVGGDGLNTEPLNFNPRSRMGSDEKAPMPYTSWARLFQSTLPHGERPLLSSTGVIENPFQSTLPHGERLWRLVSNIP